MYHIWGKPNVLFNMTIYCVLDIALLILSMSAPIPTGIFSPSFKIGAVFGRVYGYALRIVTTSMGYSIVHCKNSFLKFKFL